MMTETKITTEDGRPLAHFAPDVLLSEKALRTFAAATANKFARAGQTVLLYLPGEPTRRYTPESAQKPARPYELSGECGHWADPTASLCRDCYDKQGVGREAQRKAVAASNTRRTKPKNTENKTDDRKTKTAPHPAAPAVAPARPERRRRPTG